jgi:hypothetical protein
MPQIKPSNFGAIITGLSVAEAGRPGWWAFPLRQIKQVIVIDLSPIVCSLVDYTTIVDSERVRKHVRLLDVSAPGLPTQGSELDVAGRVLGLYL